MGQRNRALRTINGQPMFPDSIVGNFDGTIELDTVTGRTWNDFLQAGILNISVGAQAVTGGEDYIKITADGSGITIPLDWKNVGSDSIDPAAGKINRMCVLKTTSEIIYVVKVE